MYVGSEICVFSHNRHSRHELKDLLSLPISLLPQVSDIMHSLFGCHKESTLPLFERLLPRFSCLIGKLLYKVVP